MHRRWLYMATGLGLLVIGMFVQSAIQKKPHVPMESPVVSVQTGTAKNFVPKIIERRVVSSSVPTGTPQIAGAATIEDDAPPVGPVPLSVRPGRPPKTVIVRFTDDGYAPGEVTIGAGDTVLFLNESYQLGMRPASDPHPEHSVYPAYGGCISSAFDACAVYTPGDSWSFTFRERGRWAYHDHANPIFGGTVVVE